MAQVAMVPDMTADWLADPLTQRILSILDGDHDGVDKTQIKARCVGGCVRNTLLGKAVVDIDIATSLSPQIASQLLTQNGVRVYETGLAHGTITAVLKGKPFEITTLRQDVETDGRHAVVVFTDDWAQDAARRDFYINALYVDRFGAMLDPTGQGRTDISAKCVRFIGDADTRIKEDYLRILRFFRFTANYAESMDASGLAACRRHRSGLERVSVERVWSEIKNIFSTPEVVNCLPMANDINLFGPHLGEVCIASVRKLIGLEAALSERADALLRLFVGLNTNRKNTVDNLRLSLKLSNLEVARLKTLEVMKTKLENPLSHIAYKYGTASARDFLFLRELFGARPAKISDLDFLRDYVPPVFPVNGHDLLELGYSGQNLGETLESLEQKWMQSAFLLDRETLLSGI